MELVVTEFEVDPYVFDLVSLLDGTRSLPQLLHELSASHAVTQAEVDDVLAVLSEERLLRVAASPETVPERHSRQALFLDELVASHAFLASSAEDLQRRLAEAHVVIVGAGGAGSWVIQSLALTGIGTFTVIDPDVVEISNLNRQVLYLPGDVGRPKADVAVRRLYELDSSIRVHSVKRAVVSTDDLADLVASASLVINCADEPNVTAASDVVASVAQPLGIPHIVGGAYGANLGAPGTTIVPGRTVCWACIRAATSFDHGGDAWIPIRGRSKSSGSLAPIAGMVGNLLAWEAVRVILQLPPALADGIREIDLMTLVWRERRLESRPDCSCAKRHPFPSASSDSGCFDRHL
nr:ThiF family adenylyltransferase [Frondihabitans sp. VKM Ac-2883]